jgi:hypothetical protein
MNYGKVEQHLSNTSNSLEASVTSNEIMRIYESLTQEKMKEFFLDIHQEAKPIDVTTKDYKKLLKVLM